MTKVFEFVAAKQRSPEWLELRKQGIGGSDVPAILGVSPYKSRLQLWLEKTGQLEPVPIGAAGMRGVLLEDAVAKMWELENLPQKLRQWHGIIRRKDAPWKYASLDRTVVGSQKIVEIKTSSSPRWSLYPIPPEVEAQVRWQMICSGYRSVDIAALLGGLVMRIEHLEWDDEKHERIESEVEAFWHDVQTGVQPEVSPLDSGIFDRLHPRDNGETIIAEEGSDLNALLNRYLGAKDAAAVCNEAVEQAAAEIKEQMREAGKIEGTTAVATWRVSAGRKSVDWEAIARQAIGNMSDLDIAIRNHERVGSESRRFVVKERIND